MSKNKHRLVSYLLFIWIAIAPIRINGQKALLNNFASPLEIPLILSGNFGEIRSNHFHSGLDFKTNGKSGYNVNATADGYISRIKVAPGGYGKAIYIQHPSGHVSVYGHLLRFRKDIQEYVRLQQYKKESFSVDLFLDPGIFSLKQGENFALSGNSGSSQAPHLHFEIRDDQTQNPINPLLFDFVVKDKTPPTIKSIYLFSLDGRKDLKKPVKVKLVGSNGKYYPARNQLNPIDKVAGIAIECIDYLDDASNPCGINELDVYFDGELISSIQINEFSFTESKYLNSFIDFERYRQNRDQILKTYIDPNNHLSIYEFVKNRGKIQAQDEKQHMLRVLVRDIHGNQSEATIRIGLNPEAYTAQDFSKAFYSAYFNYAETNRFEAEGVDVYLSPNSLYDDLYFNYDTDSIPNNGYSRIHHLHESLVPLHRPMTVKITPETLPIELKSKALIARISENGYLSAVGGSWEGPALKVNTGSFGSFVVAVDTVAPKIRNLSLPGSDVARVGTNISFKISDNFSGISSFRGTVDGKWILFDYDAKSGTLKHETDPYIFPAGKEMNLVLRVKDGVGNLAEFQKRVVRQ